MERSTWRVITGHNVELLSIGILNSLTVFLDCMVSDHLTKICARGGGGGGAKNTSALANCSRGMNF